MKKRLMIITLILAAVAAVPFVYAGPGGHGVPGMHGHGGGGHGLAFLAHLEHVKGELGLSDAQVDQIKDIAKAAHEQNGQYREQIHGTGRAPPARRPRRSDS